MTEFVLAAVESVASALVERQEVIELSQAAWQAFMKMVDTPPPPTEIGRREARAFLTELNASAPDADRDR